MTHTRIAIGSTLAIVACIAVAVLLVAFRFGPQQVSSALSSAQTKVPSVDVARAGPAGSPAPIRYCSFYGERLEQRLAQLMDAGDSKGLATVAFVDRYNSIIRLIHKYSRADENKQSFAFANVHNAGFIIKGKKSRLLFNNNFLQSLFAFIIQESTNEDGPGYSGIRTDWPVVSVFAHMVGHYLARHDLRSGVQPYQELQADWYTGYILKRMGADEYETVYMIERFGPVKGSATHPSRTDRVAAVRAGFTHACEEQKDCKTSQLNFQFDFPATGQKLKANDNWPPKFDQVCTISGEQLLIDNKYGFVFLRKLLTDPAMARANGTRFPAKLTQVTAASRASGDRSCRFNITAEEIGLVCVRYNGNVVADDWSDVVIGQCQSCSTSGLCPRLRHAEK